MDDGNGSFTNWNEEFGQPNGGESYNCMLASGSSGTWYDYGCDYTWFAVCSKPIPSSAAATAAAHNITHA